MKKILSLLSSAALVLSMAPGGVAEAKSTYIPAPYDPAEINPLVTYMEPAVYQNENGPSIGVTTVGVICQDGLYFKDGNNNQVLDAFEDWRLSAEERAADLVSKMSMDQQAGFVLNALVANPQIPMLPAVLNEDGTVDPAKVVTVTPEGEHSSALRKYNDHSSGFASLDTDVLLSGKVRAGVYRGGLAFNASVVALYTNINNAIAEWDSARDGLPVIPFTLISNPIAAGFPDTLGMAAAVLGDSAGQDTIDASSIKAYAEVDREMWRSQGIIFMYGPQIDLVSDPRWPRNNGTYGEREDAVAAIISALVDGYQYGTNGVNEKSVVLSAKHFPGDGAAENGFESHSAQGQWRLYPTAGSLEKYQLVGFQAACDAGVGAIMPCYSRDTKDSRSVPQTYTNPTTGASMEVVPEALGSAYNKTVISDLLRDVMGFNGFINSDSGVTSTQIYGVEDNSMVERFALLIQAGTDAIGGELAPEYIVEGVETGFLAKEDLDRANMNRAIALFKMGQFDNPYLDYMAADTVRATNMATANDQAYAMHQKATVLMKNSNAALPLAPNAGTKLYIASFTGNGESEDTIAAMTELFKAQGFEIVEKASEAEVAYLYVEPKASISTNASPTEGVLSLVEGYDVPEREAVVSAYGGTGSQKKTGDMAQVTTLEGVKKIAKLAETVHGNGGKVVASIVITSPWILDTLEPYCDALVAQYTTSGASLANAQRAQVDIITGACKPTGKLSVTMPACEAVIALTETTLEDGTVVEVCASPNDVPGYDKDQYMSAEVLAQSPSGSYAYMDTDGNLYVSGFGLTY